MASPLLQRVFGLFMLLVGVGMTARSWYTALTEGYFVRGAAALGPAFAILGLAMVAFPIDKQKLLEKYGVEKPQNLSQFPLVHKVMLVLAIILGIGHFFLLWLL